MRRYNLYVFDRNLVKDIRSGKRNYIRYRITASSVDKIEIGDNVVIQNVHGKTLRTKKKVVAKEILDKVCERANEEQIPCFCLTLGDCND